MKFNVGDKLVYPYCVSMYPCVVLKIHPKTNRYQIEYFPAWNKGQRATILIDENKVFLSELDYFDSQINDKRQQISLLQVEISKLQDRRYEAEGKIR